MKKRAFTGFNIWKTCFVVFAFCLASVAPFYFGNSSEAQTTNAGTFLVANLTGPTVAGNTIAPWGQGRYFADTANNRVFETEVRNVNLPAGTLLGVFVNGQPVGDMRLTNTRTAFLRLNSSMGQTVPTVVAGTPMSVRNGATVIVSGVFNPPPTPSPSPTGSASPSPTRTPPPSPTPFPTPTAAFFAPLSGATIGGVMPRGVAQYAEFGTAKTLAVFVNHVRLPGGTVLNVLINNASVGNITLNPVGEGVLRLNTANGGTVPTIVAGDTATVKNGDATILSGTFRAFATPSPSPTVSPTPSPTRTPPPSPSPRPNRAFFGNLTGAQVVPPVTTDARGLIGVILNEAETQIQVYCGFWRLSGDQTTAKIYGPAMAGETGPAVFDLGTIGGTMGRFPVRTFDVTAQQVTQLRNGLFYAQIASADKPDGEIRGQIRSRQRPSNFLGAATEDLAVYRPSNGTWYVKDGAGYTEQLLGQSGDTPISGDFDADAKTDLAVFRDGAWTIRRSSDGGLTTGQFGLAGDIPTRGDYDGDGQTDLAVFRPSNGTWYISRSDGTGFTIAQFGLNGDVPVAADLDGDGRTDIVVFRPSTGVWYWIASERGDVRATQFGTNGDIPIAGDFDGDGTHDLAVYRRSTGVWYAWRSSDGTFDIRSFGLGSDIPVAGNYDADGVTDIAVFRPSTGVWYIWRSSDNTFDINYFGINGDVPTTKN